jgi:myo-inositol-1(or 4)-monophosphatase
MKLTIRKGPRSPKVSAPPLRELRMTAIAAALESGRVLRKHFDKKLDVREKGHLGLVTNADLESEEKCLKILLRNFPDFGVIAEESAPKKSESEGCWIVDPLDGTTNFVHRFPMFCVSIAAEWEGQVVVGVIYHPILKDLYVAVRGKGAHLNGKRLAVSKTRKLSDSLLTTGFTYQKQKLLHREMGAFERLSRIARAIRRPGSAALDLAYTGRGVFDGFWERNLSPWDVAAGSLIVEEAGGKVTDFKGGPFSIHSKEILVSNGALHNSLLQTLSPEYCPI